MPSKTTLLKFARLAIRNPRKGKDQIVAQSTDSYIFFAQKAKERIELFLHESANLVYLSDAIWYCTLAMWYKK